MRIYLAFTNKPMEQKDSERQKRLLHDRGICIVIPTYNNGGTITAVVNSTLEECQDVIVVNDGSTDDTSLQLKAIKAVTVVEYARNRGKGYALKQGFRKALEMGFAYAITLDGDGQHYPSDIRRFLQANIDHPGALILGSRNLTNADRPKGSTFANKFSNFWFCVQTGRRLDDTQTGYRLYPIRKLNFIRLLTSRYEAELELLVFAYWHGVKLVSIPINVYYPPREERVSHFRPIIDFARISVLNTVLCVLAVAYGLPLKIGRALMKYLRTCYSLLLFHILSMLVITPACWLYLKLGKMTEQKRYHLHQILHQSARFIMLRHGIPGSTFSYKVAPDADFDRPHIIICNHQSLIDLMCILIFTPKIIFLTKDWVWRNSTYGFLIRHAEYYPVSEGIEALLPKLRSVVERGYSIAVFPEGTRSKDCRIGHFHQGAFWLSEKLGLDILPMCLYGPGKVLPKKTYIFHKSPIYIQVDSPVSRAELEQMGRLRHQASAIRKRYLKEYEDIANQIEQEV